MHAVARSAAVSAACKPGRSPAAMRIAAAAAALGLIGMHSTPGRWLAKDVHTNSAATHQNSSSCITPLQKKTASTATRRRARLKGAATPARRTKRPARGRKVGRPGAAGWLVCQMAAARPNAAHTGCCWLQGNSLPCRRCSPFHDRIAHSGPWHSIPACPACPAAQHAKQALLTVHDHIVHSSPQHSGDGHVPAPVPKVGHCIVQSLTALEQEHACMLG